MTAEELKIILARGEAVDSEFKESTHQLARSIYESICAFLNRKGGHIVLGAKDDGTVVGIGKWHKEDIQIYSTHVRR